MKKLATTYVFDASLKTVQFAALSSIEQLLLITNVTDGIIIYNFADPAKGGTVSGSTVTLAHDTTLMADTDKLQIFYDDNIGVADLDTKLAIMDDWDESDRAKANIVVGQAGITAGAGAVAANTPRVTHASDDPTVTALQIMDDWDEFDRAKVNPIVGQAGIAAGAGVVGVTVPRTTLASDDPAVVALQIIDDWDESDRAKVNPIAGQAGVAGGSGASSALTQRVVLATDTTVPNVTGNIAHDVADSGNPVKVGFKAITANPAAVATGDRVDAIADVLGRQVVVLNQVRDLVIDQTTTIASSTTETTILAAAASTFHDLVAIMISNTSATAVRVDIRSATAGAVRFSIYVPAGSVAGISPTVPITQAVVNNNWTAQSSASVADLRIFVQVVKNV